MWYLSGETRRGLWSAHVAEDLHTRASCQSREGLVLVGIEGKCTQTGQVVSLARVPGDKWVSIGWEAGMVWSMGQKVSRGGDIVGIMLETRDNRLTVYQDGRAVLQKNTGEEVRRFELAAPLTVLEKTK